jgi:hypothetical protein
MLPSPASDVDPTTESQKLFTRPGFETDETHLHTAFLAEDQHFYNLSYPRSLPNNHP